MTFEEMQALKQFFYLWLNSVSAHLVLLIFLYPLMEDRLVPGRVRKALPLLLLSPLAVRVMLWLMPPAAPLLLQYFLASAQNTAVITLWAMWVWRRSGWQCLAAVCAGGLLQVSVSTLYNWTIGALGTFLDTGTAGVRFWSMSTLLLAALCISLLLGRIGFGKKFRALLESGRSSRRIGLLLMSMEAAFIVQNYLQQGVDPAYLAYYMPVVAALAVLMVALVFYLLQSDMDRKTIQTQQDIIVQQQLYEQSLEELRQEMRTFRHDYKNLFMGYAGDVESGALGESLRELEAGFDRRLGEKIAFSVQIGNLRIPQVRSLLLSKLTAMAKEGIDCRLEALYPVERVGMDVWDFVRCLGILTDNACEAARETVQPWVEIILLQQEGSFLLRVSNSRTGGLESPRIREDGYSTKGAGRGLGLASYRGILRRYPNVSCATFWEEETFVQELEADLRAPGGRLQRLIWEGRDD